MLCKLKVYFKKLKVSTYYNSHTLLFAQIQGKKIVFKCLHRSKNNYNN